MASLCSSCILRSQRAARAHGFRLAPRAFSQSATRERSIPTFNETSNAELDEVLTTIREKHFQFYHLPRREQRVLGNPANRQMLEDNPRTTQVGDEDVPLTFIDRRKEVPSQGSLFSRAIQLMVQSEDGKAFRELPALLTGMKGMKRPANNNQIERVIRKAAESGRAGIILDCVGRADSTAMRPTNPAVYKTFALGLRDWVRSRKWDGEVLDKAFREIKHLARLIEAEIRSLDQAKDRRSAAEASSHPLMLAVLLEIAAARAHVTFQGKDVDGSVSMYTSGLLSNMLRQKSPGVVERYDGGYQQDVLKGISILHGLRLSQQMIEREYSTSELEFVDNLRSSVSKIISVFEAENPKAGTYPASLLAAWKECLVPL